MYSDLGSNVGNDVIRDIDIEIFHNSFLGDEHSAKPNKFQILQLKILYGKLYIKDEKVARISSYFTS